MSLGAVVDVAIGLIFVYLLLGLLVSVLQETLTGFASLRGRGLRAALQALLSAEASGGGKSQLFLDVFAHPLIRDLSPSKLPSYVPSRNFALALIAALRAGDSARPLFSQIESAVAKLPQGPTRTALETLLTDAAGDVAKLQQNLETWFDDVMDRVSGAYKRCSHAFALILGLLIAFACNVDTINVAKTLWQDPAARAAVVAGAAQYVKDHPQLTTGGKDIELNQVLDRLPLPLGWPNGIVLPSSGVGDGWWALLGWLMTGLAVSLGAPFWFDTLQRFLNIRAAGQKPLRSDAASPAPTT